jgi:cytochrome c oxidase subunit 1
MTLAMLCFFIVLVATLLGSRQDEPGLSLPTAEAYHDQTVGLVANFTPWVVVAIVLIAIAYFPPLYEVVTGPVQAVPGYVPSSPIAPPT